MNSAPPLSRLTRAMIVQAARSWLDTPYLHQASVRGVGCDCLGLVRGVWRDVVGPEPELAEPYSADWAEAGGRESLAEAGVRHFRQIPIPLATAGDLLLFRWRPHVPAKHVAILTSPDFMVHAQDGACVCETALNNWWRRRIAYAFSFPDLGD